MESQSFSGSIPQPHLVISRRFPSSPEQVRSARRFVGATLGDAHPWTDDAMLLTSELAANAVRHGEPEGGFLVSIRLGGERVMIAIRDEGSALIPRTKDADLDAAGGRGLWLVDHIADRWGFSRSAVGTAVWFELAAPAPPQSEADTE
ncbi:ATP-binding protein [Sphaerimonospora cavernae]|uniref:ATP-binding protein n=1 Tax=Sphaerimonospora cavernae TaxID=1740611 RepID=A0ABV6U193_9ACTN